MIYIVLYLHKSFFMKKFSIFLTISKVCNSCVYGVICIEPRLFLSNLSSSVTTKFELRKLMSNDNINLCVYKYKIIYNNMI